MNLQRVSFSDNPESITASSFDCIWVGLRPSSLGRPLRGAALQWLDWKLQGQISRFLASAEAKDKVTFVPTMRRIPVPYLALDPLPSTDWGAFLKNCEGMKLKRVLYLCDDPARVPELERALKGQASHAFPEAVVLGVDSVAGGA